MLELSSTTKRVYSEVVLKILDKLDRMGSTKINSSRSKVLFAEEVMSENDFIEYTREVLEDVELHYGSNKAPIDGFKDFLSVFSACAIFLSQQ